MCEKIVSRTAENWREETSIFSAFGLALPSHPQENQLIFQVSSQAEVTPPPKYEKDELTKHVDTLLSRYVRGTPGWCIHENPAKILIKSTSVHQEKEGSHQDLSVGGGGEPDLLQEDARRDLLQLGRF